MKSPELETHIINIDRENEIRLDEKRCLTLSEFQIYCSVGKNNALKLIRRSGCEVRIGRKILVDRVRFDKWMEQMAQENDNQRVIDLLPEEE